MIQTGKFFQENGKNLAKKNPISTLLYGCKGNVVIFWNE